MRRDDHGQRRTQVMRQRREHGAAQMLHLCLEVRFLDGFGEVQPVDGDRNLFDKHAQDESLFLGERVRIAAEPDHAGAVAEIGQRD
jgi:hypothetical protein